MSIAGISDMSESPLLSQHWRSFCGARGRLSTSSLPPTFQSAESKQREPPDPTTLCACSLACATRNSPAIEGLMLFLAEQHLVAAKLLRKNGERGTGAVRELFIRKSNSCVVCVRLMAKDRGGVSLDDFDWWSPTPDWSVIETQIRRLAPPHIESPPLVPDLWSQ